MKFVQINLVQKAICVHSLRLTRVPTIGEDVAIRVGTDTAVTYRILRVVHYDMTETEIHAECQVKEIWSKAAQLRKEALCKHPRRTQWDCMCSSGPPACQSCSIQSQCVDCRELTKMSPNEF